MQVNIRGYFLKLPGVCSGVIDPTYSHTNKIGKSIDSMRLCGNIKK
jgi:hypothetical protein